MFDEHGNFKLAIVNDVLLFKPMGGWNTTLVERLLQEVEETFTILENRKWAVLDIATEWDLVTRGNG